MNIFSRLFTKFRRQKQRVTPLIQVEEPKEEYDPLPDILKASEEDEEPEYKEVVEKLPEVFISNLRSQYNDITYRDLQAKVKSLGVDYKELPNRKTETLIAWLIFKELNREDITLSMILEVYNE